nr:hypothetical protein [Helicobacter pylori]
MIQTSKHPNIQTSKHPNIQPFNHSTIQAIKQSSNQAIKQSSNQAIKQRYHTFIPFTKIRLKIFYSLLSPLLLTFLFPLALTRTAFFNHLIR